ncbi:30S ribosomal protein S1 [Rickettsia endosymbiont of Cardiosporidium cionae]|uniref:30S ribosomal protein S1 n=1 Tax=Rickettsia endosymbiont of Cardiosporidium cionae TaxID=2777155 RepID=UPI0018937629|nr:30S ribosomal protein S1 [Rickettsia endosymbiont of Cardiosporidium cionae]KAF8818227.1 30S ribosomal protein S1 [Rickettsia endosymbiont of Cardiosporidium cionae]
MNNSKKRFVPQLTDFEPDQEDFSMLLNQFANKDIQENNVVKGKVVNVNKDLVTVDIGFKSEGCVASSEFVINGQLELPNIGDIIDIYIEKIEGIKGTVLSKTKALREVSWSEIEESFNKGEKVQGVIFGRIKGGFTVDINGVVAFLPGSQVDVRPIKDLTTLMGVNQTFQILKIDKKLSNIIVSRKAVLEESRSEAKEEMLATIKEGMILDGVVKNITDYGAFIDLGSIDGLLHVTDISWSRVNHPSEILQLGQELKVVIIKYNEDIKRISLGMKQLETNPWDTIVEEFPLITAMKGKITNITDYGAFIELKDGIEGLVHSSEISWGKVNYNPRKILKIGDEVEFMIIAIDIEKHRISLSMKRCMENPLVDFIAKHPVGTVIKAPVRNITDFGLFIEVSPTNDGMIHESDISWVDKGTDLIKNYSKGDLVECKILDIDLDRERVMLGIKQLTPEPARVVNGLSKNMVVTCTVNDIKDEFIGVKINDHVHGFIKKSELSSDKQYQDTKQFHINDSFDAKIIFIKDNGKINLSIKALEYDQKHQAVNENNKEANEKSEASVKGESKTNVESDITISSASKQEEN